MPLPINTTTVRAMHDGGRGLHLHIVFIVQHARHDEVIRVGSSSEHQLPGRSSPPLRKNKHLDIEHSTKV